MNYFDNLEEKDKTIAQALLENSVNLNENGEINEAPTMSGSSYAPQVIIPLITYIQKNIVSKELINVQPIDFKKGKIFGMNLKDTSGNVIVGPDAVGTFDNLFSEKAEGANLNELVLELTEKDVSVKTRKIKVSYTAELDQDLKVLKYNLEQSKLDLIGSEIATAIDYDIIQAIINNSDYYTPIDYPWDNNGTESYQNPLYELKVAIFTAAGNIATETRKGLANFIIVPTKVQNIITAMPGFIGDPAPKLGPLSKIGKLAYLDVFINTFDTTTYDMYVGKKPTNDISGGIIYSPYKIEHIKNIPSADNFSINDAVFARYALATLNGGKTFYHKVTISNTSSNYPY